MNSIEYIITHPTALDMQADHSVVLHVRTEARNDVLCVADMFSAEWAGYIRILDIDSTTPSAAYGRTRVRYQILSTI